MTLDLQTTIEQAWENRTNLSPTDASAEVREAVEHTIDGLDLGRLRVAEKINDDWSCTSGSRRPCCCRSV